MNLHNIKYSNNKTYLLFIVTFIIFLSINIFLPSYFNAKSTTISIDFAELYDNARFDKILDKRINDVVYSKRIVISSTVGFLNRNFKLPTQFFYNFLSGLSILVLMYFQYKLSQTLSLRKYFVPSVSFLWVYYPFLFCACTLMAGFDDFCQWALASASVYYFLMGRHLISTFTFLLALLCRETSIFLLAFYLFPYKLKSFKLFHIYYIISIAIFVFIISFFGNNQDSIRFLKEERIFTFIENFYPWQSLLSTVVSVLNVFGLPFLVYMFLDENVKQTTYLKAIKVFVLVNTIFSMLFSLVDEARILGFPILFFVPYIGFAFSKLNKNDFRIEIKDVVIIIGALLFSLFIYNPCNSKSCLIYQFYTFINLMMIYFVYGQFKNSKTQLNYH